MEFNHNSSGDISIGGTVYPPDFWALVEPNYNAPPNNLIFEPGVKCHYIDKYGKATQGDKNDVQLASFVARKAIYDDAFAAYYSGAWVGNIAGEVVIREIDIFAESGQVTADEAETVIITAQIDDATSTAAISWTITAPDGSDYIQHDNLANGEDELAFSTGQAGMHTIRADVDGYGSKSISIEGV